MADVEESGQESRKTIYDFIHSGVRPNQTAKALLHLLNYLLSVQAQLLKVTFDKRPLAKKKKGPRHLQARIALMMSQPSSSSSALTRLQRLHLWKWSLPVILDNGALPLRKPCLPLCAQMSFYTSGPTLAAYSAIYTMPSDPPPLHTDTYAFLHDPLMLY